MSSTTHSLAKRGSSPERGPSSLSSSFSCKPIPLRDVLSSLVCHSSFYAPGDVPTGLSGPIGLEPHQTHAQLEGCCLPKMSGINDVEI